MNTAQYFALWRAIEELNISERDGECAVTVEWLHATEPAPRIAVDVDFASLVELGTRGSGTRLTPLRMDVARPAPRTDAHAALFRMRDPL
ncbi:hypothetical protein MSC49_37470 (plasmid) [Methylosinus sp. C49]|uniref:AraC family transcriptional regulator ligand-binding domain-containing protein n=1 Tax=Methylosinus sp. C49 TaxID=2699395 RepID=UPI001366D5EF|nr:AraC family transcriptional regulator ligand-binding domain-containing protein [Methylosinus sp. C49]BBU63812.1 hypothetical protein MSC49_37470 [Methylosinus sp. C49]